MVAEEVMDKDPARQTSQPADWLRDPLPKGYQRPVERRLFVVGGLVVGSRRDDALEVKASVDEESRQVLRSL